METFPQTVNEAAADIAAALSTDVFSGGRGRVRLFNGESQPGSAVYLLGQANAPDGTSPPGIRVRPGEWFPVEIQVTPAGANHRPVWAWSDRDGVTLTVLATGWS